MHVVTLNSYERKMEKEKEIKKESRDKKRIEEKKEKSRAE